MSEINIKHSTRVIPNVARLEKYEYEDLKYVEQFDDQTGERIGGSVRMYNGIYVCSVYENGMIRLDIPTDWVTNRKDVKAFIGDIERLDAFLAAVCENYK